MGLYCNFGVGRSSLGCDRLADFAANIFRVVVVGFPVKQILADPSGGEWSKRKPEQQMQVGPEDRSGYAVASVQEMMMIVSGDDQEDSQLPLMVYRLASTSRA
jgi:hypothetical protein